MCNHVGANQGLGFETAKALLQSHGPNNKQYHILIGCRDLAKGETAAAELRKLLPNVTGTASPVLLDVTSAAQAADAAASVEKEFGRLDVLVNNAGILSQVPGVVENLRVTLETNLFGAATATEAFLPLLLKSEGARLVFVGSSMGSLAGSGDPQSRYYKAVTGASPLEYRVSKAALNMLMLEYWKRYGVHEGGTLRVFTADPGPNATNFIGGE